MVGSALLIALSGCGGTTVPGELLPATPPIDNELSASEHLMRASVALRGRRADLSDLEAVAQDPSLLEAIVDDYLNSSDFGTVIREMHTEILLTRTDIDDPLPRMGPLSPYFTDEIYEGISEEPLKLVEHIVMNDLPYTEVVTADYMLTNETLALVHGLDFDADGAEWQVSHYADGRPHAGLLTSSELLRRHESAGSNFHRGRANFFADAFLCSRFDTRDVAVEGAIDLTDELAVAEAVKTVPSCIGCHQPMDPMAATFFGFVQLLRGQTVRKGYARDCRIDPYDERSEELEQYAATNTCYPLRMYTAGNEGDWEGWNLRAPSYFGQPIDGLEDLGAHMAADPRFAQCAARRFHGYLTQTDPLELPLEQVTSLTDAFEAHTFNAKALAKAVVMSDAFKVRRAEALGDAPVQVVRPDTYTRIIEELTGFQWLALPEFCSPEECWSVVDLGRSDKYGYRAMAGGIDSLEVVIPTHTNTPVRVLVQRRFAEEAAGYVVDSDFALPIDDRRLLGRAEPADDAEALVRDQIVDLYATILSMQVHADELEVDETYDLWQATASANTPSYAWKLVISLLLQDPRLTHY